MAPKKEVSAALTPAQALELLKTIEFKPEDMEKLLEIFQWTQDALAALEVKCRIVL